ncbi:Protein NRT1/ PTR FAMILY 5.6 [Camellia lanceoleosa]|uniref:Protein NRT1/ PTR FAMILY 5.6 n=1 Tax=Camellia lanceoleosa TaxID=1840588 RepID=A0ACC0HK28_9ERIC|nr:Protein NRT1/ PTR FAMILY 5.6 [Camellia lanceoleosa]
MVDGSSWYAKLLHATVRWFRYNIVFCKAVAFMTALFFSHSLVDNGVVGILISYLAENWKNVNLAKVASAINVQDGLSAVMMIVLAHISDTLTDRFMMVVYSTVAYVIGFGLLYLSAMFSSASNVVLFFNLAMVPIAAGRAVRDPTLHAFLGDQIGHQDGPNQDKKRVQARVNFWVRLNEFLGATVAFFVFGHLVWKVSFKISAIAMTISGVLFLCGSRFYYRKKPTGSPMTDVYCVTKAAIRKRNLDYPATPKEFYHNDKGELELFPHVALLRWLDKAAIKETSNFSMSGPEEQESRGMLCPAAQVTKVKLLLSMAPMWTTFFNYCLVVATGSTFFFLQTSNMAGNVNPTYFSIIRSFSRFIASFLYELLVPRLCTETQQQRSWKVRIGVGMFCSFLSCVAARFVEIYRLKLCKDNIGEEIIHMSVFWLTPQFCLLGFMEGLCEDGLVDFYHQQVPESMKAYGPPFNQWVLGMGNFVSILWILTFKPWFGDNINDSRLDNYYAILAIVSIANLFVYRFVSNMPIYNIDQVAEEDVQLLEILVDGDKIPVSKSFIPPIHPSITTSTRRITASTSFPEHQSRNTGIVVQKKLSYQKTM